MKTYKGKVYKLPDNGIFVFGSNPRGYHGKGNALVAKQLFGAKYGQGKGLMGKSYGIITKDLRKSKHPSVPTKVIKVQIDVLYQFAINNPHLDFYIAYSGTGALLSGFTNQQMANMFYRDSIPENIVFEETFNKLVRGL